MIWILGTLYALIGFAVFGYLTEQDRQSRYPTPTGMIIVNALISLFWPISFALGTGIILAEDR